MIKNNYNNRIQSKSNTTGTLLQFSTCQKEKLEHTLFEGRNVILFTAVFSVPRSLRLTVGIHKIAVDL